MANQQKSILAIGLKHGAPNSPYITEQIASGIDGEMQKLEAAGWHAEALLVEDRNAFDLESFKQQLGDRSWTVICVGYGLRGAPPCTPLFELVVNTITETVSPVPKFSFSTAPNGIIESMTRVLGTI